MKSLGWISRRLLQSTSLLLIIYLSILPFVFAYVRPLQYLDLAQAIPINQRTLVSKLSNYLSAPGEPADVLLLGSSLWLVPAVRCDDEMLGRPARYDQQYGWYIQDYSKALFFQKALSTKLSQPVAVTNLGITGATISDLCLIAKKSLSSGRKPKLIIAAVAPRDFMNTEQSFLTRTSVYQILGDLSCLSDLMRHKVSFTEMIEFGLGNIWHFYSERGDYRALLVNWACSITGHPQSLAEANPTPICVLPAVDGGSTLDSKPPGSTTLEKPKRRANKLNDLNLYRHRYNPPNLPMLEMQTGYFEDLLNTCRQANLPLLIVQMPLTEQNKALLDPKIHARYQKSVQDLSSKYGFQHLNIEQKQKFELSDFEDSCHLNAGGGEKLYRIITNFISENPDLSGQLASREHH